MNKNNNDIGMRFKILMDSENLSRTMFAEKLKINPSNLSHIINGRSNPGYEMLTEIIKNFKDLNIEWLLTGAGKMYKTDDGKHKFPSYGTEEDCRLNFEVPGQEKVPEPYPRSESDAMKNTKDTIVRKPVKIMVFYSDNSFEEFSPAE